MKWWTTLEKQTRTFWLGCLTWLRRSKGERQDSGGASAQQCQGYRHQRLHQDQDRLWARLCLPPDGLGNVDHHKLDRQWCVKFCLGNRCLPLFAPVCLATSRFSFLWPTFWQDHFHLPRLQELGRLGQAKYLKFIPAEGGACLDIMVDPALPTSLT